MYSLLNNGVSPGLPQEPWRTGLSSNGSSKGGTLGFLILNRVMEKSTLKDWGALMGRRKKVSSFRDKSQQLKPENLQPDWDENKFYEGSTAR